MTVSVYDEANVPATVLEQAELTARKVFDRAGVDVVWKHCSTSAKHGGAGASVGADRNWSPGSESSAGPRPSGMVAPTLVRNSQEDPNCASFEWPIHVAMRIVPRSRRSLSGRLASEVFGVAFLSAEGTGCYSDVFFDRVTEMHADWKVNQADLLGSVMAHELGHLLLGSNSHSSAGIMKSRWQGEELGLLTRGNLWFAREQSERMSWRLIRATFARGAFRAVESERR